jgi:periplasmic protein TonB
VVLGAVLWLHARAVEPEPRWILARTHIITPPNVLRPLPPSRPTSERPTSTNDRKGVIDPVDEMKPTLSDPKAGMKLVGPGTRTDQRPTDLPAVQPPVVVDPAEGAFVAFDQPPVPYYRPAPDYPGWAREQGIQGRVVLHVLVGRDGRVSRITVLRDVSGLTDAAREAIARWRFHPAISGRNPVAVWVEIPIEFKL